MSLIYEPSDDSFLLESVLKKFCKNKSVLDVGTASGFIALSALKNNSKSVTASDINKEAIKRIKEKKIKKIESDLFENIKENFDIIVFNPPYLPLDKDEDKESQLITTGGIKGNELILKFINQAIKHLNKKGIILLLLSSLTPNKEIFSLIKKLNLNYKTLASKKLFFEKLYVIKIEHNV